MNRTSELVDQCIGVLKAIAECDENGEHDDALAHMNRLSEYVEELRDLQGRRQAALAAYKGG